MVKMEMVVKCWRKLKKMIMTSSPDRHSDHHQARPKITSSRVVQCDELFLASGGKKRRPGKDDVDVGPLVAAHLAAQRHFSLRPNLYI
ncbi:hypothetical protein Vadar_028728 [Vaccinium darrowii]|uniref:Uncharacterized protein n=1 Tax=Vaccinium darrowii TaxID=229202 RepID=A0ACB7Z7J7_9ERIC|nr:hypothetical protein Vadar_028728 [Vaccinium darrowii]